jgi:hypothetical protein
MVVALMIFYNLLYNCSFEQSDTHIVSCPRVSVVLDHQVTVECPCWMMFQKILSALLYLFCLCVWTGLWVTCVLLSILQKDLLQLTFKPVSCYLVRTLITLFEVTIQASPCGDWLQFVFKLNHIGNCVVIISSRSCACLSLGNTVLSIS